MPEGALLSVRPSLAGRALQLLLQTPLAQLLQRLLHVIRGRRLWLRVLPLL